MPYPDLASHLELVRRSIANAVQRGGHNQSVEIIAVTKTHGPDAVQAAWSAGITAVGENKVQEALEKMDHVTAPVAWHLIGHLQRNKVKHLDRFALFHAVDSERLAQAIAERAQSTGRAMPVLLQVNVSGEETKGDSPSASSGTLRSASAPRRDSTSAGR